MRACTCVILHACVSECMCINFVISVCFPNRHYRDFSPRITKSGKQKHTCLKITL